MIALDWFAGRWVLTREITDYRADLVGRFTGSAVWTPQGDGLLQVEDGTLRYGSAPPMQASRRYLWQGQGQGAEIDVFFDDGRPFHRVPAPGQEALHDCPPDTYRVRYAFDGPDRFTTRWRVTGPRKDMLLETLFERD
ncbi:DUF6314 family protein [Gymnodinialimonas ceratoperidinii]|uniref:Trigger factor n=1 Tax=Gymnodinialimonas ceratoperidinii TaxID=2856823 RepID=A0A8F6TSD7_9RHOB|nr:DUF6314 family protein [Gymnodinialimonas ceratoperidinii]QXT38112.1 trigger factor [Gymnodinialimonas ceratoperidinii]